MDRFEGTASKPTKSSSSNFKMQATPPNAVAIAEPNQHEKLLGLIAAMKRDHTTSFLHQSVEIRDEDGIVKVYDLASGNQLGGTQLLEYADIEDLAEWVEGKAELNGSI
jgi:hypothetical protein